MPTHKLGQGTCNISLNMPAAERALLGQLACESDKSIGQLVRDALLDGLSVRRPDVAAQVKKIRINHRAAKAATCLAVLLFGLFQGVDEFRARGNRRLGRRDDVVEVCA